MEEAFNLLAVKPLVKETDESVVIEWCKLVYVEGQFSVGVHMVECLAEQFCTPWCEKVWEIIF